MLRHYLRTGFRNFIKHKTSSLINALGLSLAVGCSLFVFIFIEFFMTMDEYHAHSMEIFVVNREVLIDNGTRLYSGVPEPMAPQLQQEFASVVDYSRLKNTSGYIRSGNKVFEENLRFVDPAFLRMFSFPLKWGLSSSLNDPHALILSEKMSEKYFGSENPVGEQVTIKFIINGEEHIEPFVIRGVAEEFRRGSSFAFNFLINYEMRESLGFEDLNSWSVNNDVTFLQLSGSEAVKTIEEGVSDYVNRQNVVNKDLQLAGYVFTPFLTASREGQKVVGNIFSSPGVEGFIVLSVLATIIMVLACINYMNIAMASAAYRLKEIGIRKVMGGVRHQLIRQFLAENLIVCTVALLLGILWTQVFFLPGFKSLIPNPLALDLADYRLWTCLAIVLLITVIGGAGYPALYVSRFQPVAILKDSVHFGGRSTFRKVLLGFQYFFSFIAVIAALVLIQNDRFQRERSWGYDQGNKVVVNIKGGNTFDQIKEELTGEPSIAMVAGSYDQVGRSSQQVTFDVEETRFTADRLTVGWNYIETMGLRLVAGRVFDPQRTSDTRQSVVINEQFARELGWEEAVGRTLKIGDETVSVIGVLVDFHYFPFWKEISPMMLRVSDSQDYRYLTVRANPGELMSAGMATDRAWQKLFPDDPYDYFYQDTVFDNAFRELDMATGVITTAGFIAIFLAMIGLFGLSALRIKSKMKEISIRKILGGSWLHLGLILNKEFMFLLGLASLIATPVAYQAVVALLGTITKYPMPISILPFMLTITLLIILSVVAVGGHVMKAVRTNPSDVLRNE